MHRPLASWFSSALASLAASGCYVVPVYTEAPAVPQAAIVVPSTPPAHAPIATMSVRLYPANEITARRGMLVGKVVALGDGRGRFLLEYDGDVLSGEATRVRGDAQRGIANAYGARGTFMTCEYRMAAPTRGTGSCTLGDGARYSAHLGE